MPLPRAQREQPEASDGRLDSDRRAVIDCIRRLVHWLETGSREAQKSVGLSGAQLFVLRTLAAGGTLSVNELADVSHTHQSSVSVVVTRLVEARLVKRTRCASDARRVELSLTAAGRRLLQVKFVTPQERLFAALGELSPTRLGEFRSLLEEVLRLGGADSGTPPMFFEREGKGQQKRRPVRSQAKEKDFQK